MSDINKVIIDVVERNDSLSLDDKRDRDTLIEQLKNALSEYSLKLDTL